MPLKIILQATKKYIGGNLNCTGWKCVLASPEVDKEIQNITTGGENTNCKRCMASTEVDN